jgi:hypothetical protein
MPSKDLDLYAFTNLRNAMKKLHKYVNDCGGYTILGYTQLGESTDVSDKLMKVDSLYPTIHLVYLHPTDLNLPITAEYKKLMFTLTNHYKNASMQPNPPTSPTIGAQPETTRTTASRRLTKARASSNINLSASKKSRSSI